LGCGKGEGSPNPPPTQPGARRTVPANAATKFDRVFSATGFGVASKQRDLRVTGARLHLDSFQDSPCPAAAGLFIPTG
jgi:hypothetical protein